MGVVLVIKIKMAAVKKRDPSQIAKGRICTLVQQDIEEFGKIVRYVRQSSSTREVSYELQSRVK